MAKSKKKLPLTIYACGPQCADGTENHIWDGPEVKIENGSTASCSKCGKLCMEVCLWWDDGLEPRL